MSSGSSSTGPKQDASVAHNDSIAAATPTKVESAAGTASTHESTTSTDSTKQETSSHTAAAAAAASAEPTQAAPEREWGKLARQPTYNQQDVKRVQMEIYLSRNGYIPPEHKQSKDSEKFDK